MKKLVAVFVALASFQAIAKTDCKPKQWDQKRDWPLPAMKQYLDKKDRKEILQMAWSETTAGNKDSVALPLWHYLGGTEQDQNLRGYYKTMGTMLTKGAPLEEAVQKWPERAEAQNSVLKLKELCDLYVKSGGK